MTNAYTNKKLLYVRIIYVLLTISEDVVKRSETIQYKRSSLRHLTYGRESTQKIIANRYRKAIAGGRKKPKTRTLAYIAVSNW